MRRRPAIHWLVLLAVILLPAGARAHGEVEGGGEETTLRTIEGKTGKYRVEFTISPSLPVAGDDTNMELKILRVLPKPDPLLGYFGDPAQLEKDWVQFVTGL